ncbi:response regulator transcription factor [Demequina capsici]|uniref:Response regulator transcription factor n=1 Tax=Demequina capsici TaxID=3075620 RepID=A0AA96FC97_9MICO|nr:response regulator transcription factor [Demequina sp. PMTSA13]WNM26740.1 response regulator transcription factor [Demequina sp. PMTSA13]
MRVLLVEDDAMVGAAMVGRLEDDAYAVDWVRDARSAAASVETHTYDVLLLDLGLPDVDGIELLARLRRGGEGTPIIVVTARDDVGSRVTSLDGGADDYIVKPFDSVELMARMRAVLRRRGETAYAATLEAGTLRLELDSHAAVRADGTRVDLPRREFAVLRALMSRPGAILSRTELEHQVYGWGDEVESNAIEYAIHRLRTKLGSEVIRNIRGVGWMVPRQGRPS